MNKNVISQTLDELESLLRGTRHTVEFVDKKKDEDGFFMKGKTDAVLEIGSKIGELDVLSRRLYKDLRVYAANLPNTQEKKSE